MSVYKWKTLNKQRPQDGQRILAKFKHGTIECFWDDKNEVGTAYVWQYIEFYVYAWVPVEALEVFEKEETK